MKLGCYISDFNSNSSKSNESPGSSYKILKKVATKYNLPHNCIQVYVSGPYTTEEISKADRSALKKIIAAESLEVHAHASFLDHIMGKRYGFAIYNIRKEIEICKEIGIKTLCVHLPKYGDASAIVEAAVRVLPFKEYNDEEKIANLKLNIKSPFTIILENEPHPAHTNPQFLADLVNQCNARRDELNSKLKIPGAQLPTFGLVLDTAHLYSAGLHIEDEETSRAFLSVIDSIIKPGTVLSLQLNDQKWPIGSLSDQHESIGEGQIWGRNRKSLHIWVEWANKHNGCIILERGADRIEADYQRLRELNFDN